MPLAVRESVVSRQPSSSTYGKDVWLWMNVLHPGKETGVEGPTARSYHLPDLTPMDFSMWGHLKEPVYEVPPRSFQDLVVSFRQMLRRSHRRVKVCAYQNTMWHNANWYLAMSKDRSQYPKYPWGTHGLILSYLAPFDSDPSQIQNISGHTLNTTVMYLLAWGPYHEGIVCKFLFTLYMSHFTLINYKIHCIFLL